MQPLFANAYPRPERTTSNRRILGVRRWPGRRSWSCRKARSAWRVWLLLSRARRKRIPREVADLLGFSGKPWVWRWIERQGDLSAMDSCRQRRGTRTLWLPACGENPAHSAAA
jgi:hypothetical protein